MRLDLEYDNQIPHGRATAQVIQDALDLVHNAGGGTVSLGPGIWVSGTVALRSLVELNLQRGCVLQASTDLSQYEVCPDHADNKDQSGKHLIVAEHCENLALTGPGVIDGQDTEFLEPVASDDERVYGIFKLKLRGGPDSRQRPCPLIELAHCRDLVVENLHILRSPGWTLHLYDCHHARVQGVTIRNNLMAVNADGVGINGCRDVIVSQCDVETGDDAFIVKSTNVGVPCERVMFSQCIASTNCSAFGCGAEVAGDVRDIVFTNCIASKSLRLIKLQLWQPGTVERITFDNITGATFPDGGVTCERAIYIDIQQFVRPTPTLGHVRDITVRNVTCRTRGRIVMTAQDGSVIENVLLDNILLEVPEIEDPAVAVPASKSMQNSNFNPHTRAARAAVVADNVHNLTLRDLVVRWPELPGVAMDALCLRGCESVRNESPRLQPCGVRA
ncbi:MAG: hypothetical protein GC164_11745 [Phycisphaera sp.]|nr:hypothetical protein [Phycisphaera sp.]